MTLQYRFVQVVDTVSMRGNKLFGDPGSHGESQFPPRPSVLSGAFRSVLWTRNGGDAKTIQQSAFSITGVFAAQQTSQGQVNVFMPLPADLVISKHDQKIRKLTPTTLPHALQHGQLAQLPMLPLLKQGQQSKADSGWLLNQAGIQAYLSGSPLHSQHLQHQSDLWARESRIGIGLQRSSRTAEDGKLFTVEHTAPTTGSGLVVGIAHGEALPDEGFLRLGGDGKAAHYRRCDAPAFKAGIRDDRFKLVLTSPGLFQQGWLPEGMVEANGHYWLKFPGGQARLACASVSRAEVVSGWDLEKWCPKVAERVVPAGSVYWFDQLQGDPAKLEAFANNGLWPDSLNHSLHSRRAEGYNRVLLSAW